MTVASGHTPGLRTDTGAGRWVITAANGRKNESG